MSLSAIIEQVKQPKTKDRYKYRLEKFRKSVLGIKLIENSELSLWNHDNHEDHNNHSNWNPNERSPSIHLKLVSIIQERKTKTNNFEMSNHTDHDNHTDVDHGGKD